MSFDRTRLPAGLTITCLSATFLLGAPAGALASDVTLRDGVIEIAAPRGEVNRIEIARSAQGISFTDSVRITRPEDCQRVSATNIVCPGTGIDTVRALAGDRDDAVLVRNGTIEEIACGDGLDSVTADADDVIAPDCERVEHPAATAPDADPILVIQPVTGPEPFVAPPAQPPAQFDLSTPVPAPAAGARTLAAPALPARLRRVKAIVRLAGTLTARGARIKLLSVRGAPRGAAVEVSCRGRGCPPAATRTVRSSGLRFAPFQRTLGAGTVITIAVRSSAAGIGKHTRFVIRRGAAPARTDACLMPGASAPTRCQRR